MTFKKKSDTPKDTLPFIIMEVETKTDRFQKTCHSSSRGPIFHWTMGRRVAVGSTHPAVGYNPNVPHLKLP